MIPLISFCIPTYNRATAVLNAVTSILESDNTNIQIVVSDNGSTDSTKYLLGKITDTRFKYVRNNRNMGFAYNLLNTFQNADGRFLFTLSDEDRINNEKIEDLATLIQHSNNVGIILDQISQFPKQMIVPTKTYVVDTYLQGDIGLAEYSEFRYKTYVSGYIINKDYLDLDRCFSTLSIQNNEFISVFPHIYIGILLAGSYGFINSTIHSWDRKEYLDSDFSSCYEIKPYTSGFCQMLLMLCRGFINQAFILNTLQANYFLYQSIILGVPSFYMAHTSHAVSESFFRYTDNIEYFCNETKRTLNESISDIDFLSYISAMLDANFEIIKVDASEMEFIECRFREWILEYANISSDIYLYGAEKNITYFISQLHKLRLYEQKFENLQYHLFDFSKSKYSPDSELVFKIPTRASIAGEKVIVFSSNYSEIHTRLKELGAICIWYRDILK